MISVAKITTSMYVLNNDLMGQTNVSGHSGGYQVIRSCAQIDNFYHSEEYVLSLYPSCSVFYNGKDIAQNVLVNVDMDSETDAIQINAALGIGFGSAGWIAWWIHAVLVELYLRLTPAESERLREVSFERQRERGMKNPGSAGLVVQKLGDAPAYIPLSLRKRVGSLEEMGALPKHNRNGSEHAVSA
jgi:hypothetical protein